MTQSTNNQPHLDDELLTEILSDLIYDTTNSYGWPPDYEPDFDQAKQQILKRFVPKEEVERAVVKELSHWASFFTDPSMNAMTPSERLEKRIAQLTNNQPNTPKGEGE